VEGQPLLNILLTRILISSRRQAKGSKRSSWRPRRGRYRQALRRRVPEARSHLRQFRRNRQALAILALQMRTPSQWSEVTELAQRMLLPQHQRGMRHQLLSLRLVQKARMMHKLLRHRLCTPPRKRNQFLSVEVYPHCHLVMSRLEHKRRWSILLAPATVLPQRCRSRICSRTMVTEEIGNQRSLYRCNKEDEMHGKWRSRSRARRRRHHLEQSHFVRFRGSSSARAASKGGRSSHKRRTRGRHRGRGRCPQRRRMRD